MLLAAHCALKFEISFRKYITSLDLKNKSISIAKGKTDLLNEDLIFKTSFKGGFFSKTAMCFSNHQNKYSNFTILSLKFKQVFTVMGGNSNSSSG